MRTIADIDADLEVITLPPSGWFVDIEAAESISVLMRDYGDLLTACGVDQLTTEHLHGTDRLLTTSIAEAVHQITLSDGSLPHGIHFTSKHDRAWECWSVWLRMVDDGKHLSSEPTSAHPGDHIEPPALNKPLRQVCDLFRLICH
ncbi:MULTISPECIES: hypothetical protein [unclassified Mycolicibacterium]|uniref:hypothetical protein n=1 Tax=unclassified Mycolicibacterium TaxID=2636767 RepID=UPI001BB3E015|nr:MULTISPECIES: hypothetical protein [unclassified Mycolicibacterium]BCJ83973.1 hypothetical protein MTY81_53460 [Mycolicibacterium sp. TY81]